jgi:hypothetical protein
LRAGTFDTQAESPERVFLPRVVKSDGHLRLLWETCVDATLLENGTEEAKS